jgi:phospholipid/cholesterol/gamma-HCH transport system substrate-binding protein
MDLHYKQEVTVGVLVLAGVGLFLGGTMWLRGKSFSTAPQVEIVFPDAGTLKRGSPVRVSGVALGSVDEIEFKGVGEVVVRIRLEPVVVPKIDASARLATIGLVADAIVVFDPGTAAEPLPPGRRIQGVVDRGLTELGADLGGQAREVMTGLQDITNRETADELRKTLRALQRTLDLFANTRQGPTAQMTQTLRALQGLSQVLDSTLAVADLPRTLRASDSLFASMAGTSAEFRVTGARLDTLLQGLNRGEGTLGKLLTDSLLYNDVRKLTGSMQELVDELRRNPGKITIQVKVF